MTDLTRDQIEEWLRLAEAATEGPWTWGDDIDRDGLWGFSETGEPVIGATYYDGPLVACYENDRDFIAASRTLLPRALRALLLALPVVEAARSQDKAWRDGPQRLHNQGWCDACVDVQRAIREHDRQEMEEAAREQAR